MVLHRYSRETRNRFSPKSQFSKVRVFLQPTVSNNQQVSTFIGLGTIPGALHHPMSEHTLELKTDFALLKKSSRKLTDALLAQRFGVPRIHTASSGGRDPFPGPVDSTTTATAAEPAPETAKHTVLTAQELELLELQQEIEELNMAMMTLNVIRKVENETAGTEVETNGGSESGAAKKLTRYTNDLSEVNAKEEELLKEELRDRIRILSHRNKLKQLTVDK